MSLGIPMNGPGVGLRVANSDYLMTAGIAVAKGDLLAVDTTVVVDNSFTTMVAPITAADTAGSVDSCICGVALKAGAADDAVVFRFAGVVEVMGKGTVLVGELVGPATSKGVVKATAATRGVGFAMEGLSSGAIGTVLFDGLSGVNNKA